MRHRVGLLGTATSLLLAVAVATAAPAEARRNVGGFGDTCDATPGKALAGKVAVGVGATEICFTETFHGAGVVIAPPSGR